MAGPGERNDSLVDMWSFIHMGTGILMGLVMDPFLAMVLMILWEPFEILVLSPIVYRLVGKEFGHESIRNSLSDIFFDGVGVAIGFLLQPHLIG